MLYLGFATLAVAAVLAAYAIHTVKPDEVEVSAFLAKIFNFTFKLGRNNQAQRDADTKKPGIS